MKNEQFILSNYNPIKGVYVIHGGRYASYPHYINDCYMAAYTAHGSGTLNIDNETIDISEGDVFLINPDVAYKISPKEGLRRIDIYFCYFTSAFLSNGLEEYEAAFPDLQDFYEKRTSFIHAVDSENKEIRDIFIRMIDEQLSGLPCNSQILAGYVSILLTHILRNAKTRGFRRVYSQNRTVDEAIRYIYDRLYSNITLTELASHLNVSTSYICRIFKKYVGMTTVQFVHFLRVEKIKDVLKNTSKPASAVPEMFGCNVEYLKQIFKKETGMTMQEYQDEYNYRHTPTEKEK